MLNLPQEIRDMIIGHLDYDRQSLRSCALVSSSFREPSQRQLFRIVIVRSQKCKRFDHIIPALHTAFTLSPHLASFVRGIGFQISKDKMDETVTSQLCAVLHAMTAVERAMISSCTTEGWRDIADPVKTALLHVLHLPSCQSLVLGLILFPQHHLSSLSHLRHLDLVGYFSVLPTLVPQTGISPITLPVNASSEPRYLNSLRLGEPVEDALSLFDNLTSQPSRLSLERLRVCSLTVNPLDIQSSQRLFDHVSNSLVWLNIEFHIWGGQEGPALPDLRNLKSLQYLILRPRGDHIHVVRVPWIPGLVDSLPVGSGTSIKIVVLLLDAARLDVGTRGAAWRQFDEAFSSVRTLEAFKLVVRFRGDRKKELQWKKSEQVLTEQLPRLHARGVLSLQLKFSAL